MGEATYSNGKELATWMGPSLPGRSVEPDLRGRMLDEYRADYESRRGPVSEQARQRARQALDAVFAEENELMQRPKVLKQGLVR